MKTSSALAVLLASAVGAGAWVDGDVEKIISRRKFWAFQKPVRAEVPRLENAWVRNPVDAFILAALRGRKLSPSAPAPKERLLRRVALDLTGLPPDPAETDRFLADRSPDAYEKLVDRLMASPHYGERWALRWLDVVRYADTNGYEVDGERPHAWRYRDYVVRAFNSDKPFDRFLREQIAGDELYPGDREALIATGFHRAGPIHLVSGNKDEEMNRQEVLTEMAAGVASAFLGLTVGCARCHNHKFDPILQSDYYRLQAVFGGTEFKDVDICSAEEKAAFDSATEAWKARLKPVEEEIKKIEKPYRDALEAKKTAALDPALRQVLEIPKDRRNEEQKRLAKDAKSQVAIAWDELLDVLTPADRARRAKLRDEIHELERYKPQPPPAAYAVVNTDKPVPQAHILKVGDHKHKLAPVDPGVPVVFEHSIGVPKSSEGRRSALANWLASPEHPLTARVMVNRIWQFRMGAGLVRTPNDFGALGERPTNPPLLDWLATEFMARKWSVKSIDRMIVLSSVYRQAADPDAAKAAVDPENKLYWRMNRKRLEGEIIRDSVLRASGMLEPRLGGPPVKIPLDPEVYELLFTEGERDGLWPVTPERRDLYRRSLYLINKRSVRLPMLAAFDQPDTMSSCPMRLASTHALQALSLFNSEFMQHQSDALARRLERECGNDVVSCAIRRAYKLSLARAPKPAETSMARDFLAHGGKLSDFCLALLNRNEFVYVP